jgi:3'-phosphoadenosine 5'-phosphosulfate sulfotransferase (PAPS reductase)/FAD synthetase
MIASVGGRYEVQSFGGGVQSVALAILNVTGRVTPRADLAIFADPGSEEEETYRLLPVYLDWLAARGYPLVTVTATEGPLLDYLQTRSTVIPIHSPTMLGHRQCTNKWKLSPIKRYVRAQGATMLIQQLGISLDEFYRVKPARDKWITNRWPLVELGLTRADCRAIIEAEGLPVPPKSACWFCPFQNTSRWQWRAINQPDQFEAACALEDTLNERQARKGKPHVYLSGQCRSLRTVVSGAQMTLDDAMEDGYCDGGVCFV